MSMKINSIILSNKKSQIRKIDFNLNGVNIITGRSNTGKSSLIKIVDYCLGRSEFKIPEGKIKDNVTWYGVIFQINELQVLVAKEPPKENGLSNSEVYYDVAKEIILPKFEKISPNSNDQTILDDIGEQIGILSSELLSEEGDIKKLSSLSLKHSKYYLFQPQNLITDETSLFYRQNEDFIPLSIKETIPYFLGAVENDYFYILKQRKNAKRLYQVAKRRYEELESILASKSERSLMLYSEAVQVGLINTYDEEIENEKLIKFLHDTLNWKPKIIPEKENEQLAKFQHELIELQKTYKDINHKINSAKDFSKETDKYLSEAQEQSIRLKSINFFTNTEDHLCPLCNSYLNQVIPNVDEIQTSLKSLERDLSLVHGETPKLNEYIENLIIQKNKLQEKIDEIRKQIESVYNEIDNSNSLRDSNSRIARVVGRISLFLESVELIDTNEELRNDLLIKKENYEKLEELIREYDIDEKLNRILRNIEYSMTKWAKDLDLEHSKYNHSLDIKKLTVVAHRPDRPITMDNMGGGKNWLGCHLISHLALHKYFLENSRPVPNFLFLDQPTQVYFPDLEVYKRLSGNPDEMEDEDKIAVEKMFNFLFSVCEDALPNFQIIITEHANLGTEKFSKALIEDPWTDGNALIPENWLK